MQLGWSQSNQPVYHMSDFPGFSNYVGIIQDEQSRSIEMNAGPRCEGWRSPGWA